MIDCNQARTWMFRHLDGELTPRDEQGLQTHVGSCSACARELRILSLPRRLAATIPVLEPSPFFYQRLRAQLDAAEGRQNVTIWQIVLGLSRQVVPALASITLALVSLFMYTQLHTPSNESMAYDGIFITEERPQTVEIADFGDVTDETILRALAESDGAQAAPATSK